MKKPNTLTLQASARGFNWFNPSGNVTLDCNEPANADWPTSGVLAFYDYQDNTHVIDLWMAYSALARTAAPGGGARFTCTAILYPGGFNPGGPPPIDTIQAFTTPASLGASFFIDFQDKITNANWNTQVGTTLTVIDSGTGNVAVMAVTAFSATGGVGAKARFTGTLLSGPLSTAFALASPILQSASASQTAGALTRVVLGTLGPVPYTPSDYFD